MTNTRKGVTQHPRQNCYFCGSEGPIETHHIIPRRHGGGDDESNLVDICPNCHRRLETLYNKRFYEFVSEIDLDSKPTTDGNDSEKAVATKQNIDRLHEIINELEIQCEMGAEKDKLYRRLIESGVAESLPDASNMVTNEQMRGDVYEPRQGYLRSTKQ